MDCAPVLELFLLHLFLLSQSIGNVKIFKTTYLHLSAPKHNVQQKEPIDFKIVAVLFCPSSLTADGSDYTPKDLGLILNLM